MSLTAAAGPETARPPTQDEARRLTEAIRELFLQAKRKHRHAHEQGTDHGRLSVLITLDRQGPARASDLSRELMLDLSTVSRHVRSLESEGLLAKTVDPDDKRAWRVELTEAGAAHIRDLWEGRVQEALAVLGDWTAHDVTTLTDLLFKLVRDTEGHI